MTHRASAAGALVILLSLAPACSSDQLTVASGLVVYELAQWSDVDGNGQPIGGTRPVGYQVQVVAEVAGVLAVQVNADGSLTVEKRPDIKASAGFTAFSEKAETFWR